MTDPTTKRRYIEISGGGLASLTCLPEEVERYIFDFVAEPDEPVTLRSIYLTDAERAALPDWEG
ncbi:MAG: hypothetical protein BGP24_14890 [Lysobacterales bacterium 69-70]|nr:hypothetical protein [Xanthomonadaceae bacterium]ODU35370.1 MAG: hypothetical protein ABS97_05715 [Xanthomonadaceae bacterium SCN 69-320]ODV16865.1 MAG: hypothetical protein ABT27_19000 [Xanthomonadaceae bacterium SCN 69-25]OJY94265.1 MAG: hypothetical protein BGP24_14890 [Xanthomonadales bacterium 69-70]